MAVDRRSPISSGGPKSGVSYGAEVDEEIYALWNRAAVTLMSIAGTDNITATANPQLDAYAAGQAYWMVPVGQSTGPATLNIDSRGVKSIVDANGDALIGGELRVGRRYLLYYNGTNFRVMNARHMTFAIFKPGRPLESILFYRHEFDRAVTFPAGLPRSRASAAQASATEAVFSLRKNGVEFATVTFDSSATGVYSAPTTTDFAAGDVLTVVSPSPQDSLLSDVALSLVGAF